MRFGEIVSRFIEELGRYPTEDGLLPYRDIDFPDELSWKNDPDDPRRRTWPRTNAVPEHEGRKA